VLIILWVVGSSLTRYAIDIILFKDLYDYYDYTYSRNNHMDFRVVTACYTDTDILDSWIPKLDTNEIVYTIYHKSDILKKGEIEILNNNNIRIPNYGRCDYAFLYHIVSNYEKLDNITLFVKNNWNSQHIDLWNHIETCKKYDFMESGKQRRFLYWRDDYAPFPKHEEVHKSVHNCAQTTIDWYYEIFPGINLPHVIPGWGMGPCFSVSRRLIHRHPKSVYEKLLQKFYPESNSWDREKAKNIYTTIEEEIVDIGKHYHDCFQRFWYVLFTHNIDSTEYAISNHSWNNYD